MAAKTPVQLRDVDNALELVGGSFVELPKIDVPYTTIVKRAQCTDFSNDLRPRMGVERLIVQLAQEVQGESGPGGEKVYKPVNDLHDQVRFVGSWFHLNDGDGAKMQASLTTDYIEITFYGTGLNVLCYLGTANRGFGVTVDGVAQPDANISGSAFMAGRRYSPNIPINVASGLSLGLHTVKLTSLLGGGNGSLAYGFEILNEATTIKTAPGSSFRGGKKLTLATLDSQAYNSGFEATYGTPGTKGGHVVVYQKADGSIGKAIRYTEVSTLTNTSTNHTNEELIRRYTYREFGAGRTDDFSSLTPGVSSSRAFTLDDGTTSLVSVSVVADLLTLDNIDHGTSSSFTFVGTGLDFHGSTGTDTRFSIDGGAEVVLPSGVSFKTLKIASGLAYGTHTVKLTRPGSGLRISSFDVYGPKKPTIPTGAVEIADYYLMADFDFSGLSASSGASIPQGVLFKTSLREVVYIGANWAVSGFSSTHERTGFDTSPLANNGQTAELTFTGTGVVVETENNLVAFNVYIDGVLNATGQVSGATNTGAGVYTGNGTFNRVAFTGLSYGTHKVKIERTGGGGGFLRLIGFHIITPIHSPKSNLPGMLQSILPVGSCSIGDSRVFAESQDLDIPSWAQAFGFGSSPTIISTAAVPMTDMICTVKTNGNPIVVNYSVRARTSAAAGTTFVQAYVDGVAVGQEKGFENTSSNDTATLADSIIVPVMAGVHTVQVFWRVSAGTGLVGNRNVSVMEL